MSIFFLKMLRAWDIRWWILAETFAVFVLQRLVQHSLALRGIIWGWRVGEE